MALMAFGGALVLVGAIGWIASGNGTSNETVAPTQTTSPGTLAPVEAADTPTPSVTETGDTPTTPPTTTSTEATTTTIDVNVAIATFVVEFSQAINSGDTDFLNSTLHPAVLEIHGELTCNAFIEAEILLLQDYQLVGSLAGPPTQTFGTSSVEVFTGMVTFTLQGQEFEATASFALEDGQVRWFAECRE